MDEKQAEKPTKQVGLLTKGGGLNESHWIENAKKEGLIVKEFPGYYEFHTEEKVKK